MVTLNVNGKERQAPDPERNLLSYLRFDLGLTGTKYSCGEGLCGACTVLVDGQTTRSCTTTVGAVAGGDIVTIEGLAQGDVLHPVQQAFVEENAMQCGYCIPGFVLSAVALLNRQPHPSTVEIRESLGSLVCRCGSYVRLERAVTRAAELMEAKR